MDDLSFHGSNKRAKLFWTGRSQAVRLPKEFRFEGEEVKIRREGNLVILEAEPQESDLEWAQRIAGSMSEDFARAVEEGHLGPEHLPDGPSFD